MDAWFKDIINVKKKAQIISASKNCGPLGLGSVPTKRVSDSFVCLLLVVILVLFASFTC